MKNTIMELVWLVLIYSFLGWVIETIVGTIKKKKFVNRGFSTGPFCLVYGVAALFMTITMEELMAKPVFQFIGCGVLATIVEWMAGKLLEHLNQHKWWDYSDKKWNFDGYICLQYSLLWAVLGLLAVRYGDSFFLSLYHMIPSFVRDVMLWILIGGMVLDMTASLAAVFDIRKEMTTAIRWNKQVAVWTQKFARMIVGHVEKRIAKAYPVLLERDRNHYKGKFAEGCGFY
ncbi:MAG: putative ABC transporter permease [Lachnospiraceae bacterium]